MVTVTVKQVIHRHIANMFNGETLRHEFKTESGYEIVCLIVKRETFWEEWYEGWENGNLVYGKEHMNLREATDWILNLTENGKENPYGYVSDNVSAL